MLGLNGGVLPPCLFDFVAGSREPLLPMLVELPSFAFDILHGGKTQLQRGRRNGLQQPLDNERLQHGAR
jgi:hypothetical protein